MLHMVLITIEKKIKAEVLMEGETVVVGKYFVEFAKKLEDIKLYLVQRRFNKMQIIIREYKEK